MKRFARVTLLAIVGSLCFSVGEGLRLTPFPVSNQLQIEEPNGLSVAKDAGGKSLSKYGPLDVPSQLQKRGKRQTTDFASHPQAENCPAIALVSHYLVDESVRLRPSLSVSRPAGRAPPLS